MEEIQLSETEQRYFGDLFTCCDSEKTGKVPIYKASELFRSANLPHDVLKQITEVCGGRGTHLGRRQFYSALKLIAAYQAGLPLRADLDVPLPRLSWPSSVGKWEQPHIRQRLGSPDLIQLSDTDRTPTPQKDAVSRVSVPDGTVDLQADSPQHNGRSLSPASSTGHKTRSPEASSTASDSPTPTNSVQERNWVKASQWRGIVCEEQRQLLGTEEESSDRHSSEDEADAEAEAEVWTITDEQRDYYSAQFRSLQPDPSGLIAGPVARLFFEKSRLPVHELRKIWQLADITKDGALSLDEFNTAMHLVVLRRNNIDLPDALPASLVPPMPSPPPTQPPLQPPPEPVGVEESPPLSLSPPTGEPTSPPRSKEWTKFVDSPTSSVSSPGPKPVNFDFHKSAVEQDPKILHPVPLRLTPESQGLPPNEEEPRNKLTEPQPIPYEQLGGEGTSPKKALVPTPSSSLETGSTTCVAAADIRPIQRPQAKKPAAPGPGAIPPPPQAAAVSTQEEINANQTTSIVASGPTSLPAVAAVVGASTTTTTAAATATTVATATTSAATTAAAAATATTTTTTTTTTAAAAAATAASSSSAAAAAATAAAAVGVSTTTQMGPKKEPPPPPPPRPYRTHTRSSSLDLNRLGKAGALLGTPPAVPPRISPSTTSPKKLVGQRSEGDVLALVGDQASFADFTQFSQEEDNGDVSQPRRHGAFEVYRKPVTKTGGSDAALVLQEADSPTDDLPSHRHRPREALRRLQEQNSVLVRRCQELAQELAEVQEERAALELQLEQLRSSQPQLQTPPQPPPASQLPE